MKNLNSFLFVFLFLSGLFATNVYAQRYDIIDIVSAGNPGPYPYDINNKNQIVGDYSPYFPTTVQAFIYENGLMRKLITDPLITSSHAYRINDSSQIVGRAVFPLPNGTSAWHAFFWAEGVLTDIDMSGGTNSIGAAINNNGQVVGSFTDTTAHKVHSFIWQNGVWTDLGSFGGNNSGAVGINDNGQIIGNFYEGNSTGDTVYGYLWHNGNITNLGPMVFPEEINNQGQVVGKMRIEEPEGWSNLHGFIWEDGVLTDLGDILENYNTYVYGINNQEQIVGSINGHAFIWEDGTATYLDSLHRLPYYSVTEAYAINDSSSIVGWGYVNAIGNWKAFLLKLKPLQIIEPELNELWIAGEKDTIRWINGPVGVNIKIEYSIDGGITYSTIVNSFPANSGEYGYTFSSNVLTRKALIRLTNIADTTKFTVSSIFRIKPYILTKLNPDQTYYEFQKNRDQWGFSNTPPDMWPPTWYNQFNYQGVDPFTNLPYNQIQVDSTFAKSSFQYHPDWVSWVNAFSINASYYSTILGIYKPTAVLKWKSRGGNWNGSCFGIAASNALAFSYKNQFQNKYPNFPVFTSPITVSSDAGVKKVVNELFSHQFGGPSTSNDALKFNIITPSGTVEELKQMLKEDIASPKTLSIMNNNGPGGHTILAYGLQQDTLQNNIYYIKVYDNSNPNSNNPITVNLSANGGNGSWSTPDWSTWGGSKNIYLEVVANNYLINATLAKSQNEPSPFILSENSLEISHLSESPIKIIDSQGNITGYENNIVLNQIPGSAPSNIKNGSETPPYAYLLPTDNYSVILNDFVEDTINTYFFTGNKSFMYEREGAIQTQTDRLFFDGGVSVTNPDQQSKTISLLNIINETTQEKLFALSSIELAQNDSLTIENPDSNKIKLISFGTAKDYDIEINYATENGLGRFGDLNIPLQANTSHTFVPNWTDITNTDLEVLVDIGNDGTIDDTLSLINQLTGLGNDQGSVLPTEFRLEQNFPNPFNPTTTIQYSLPQRSNVTLKVYDVLGNEVATLVNEEKGRGIYSVNFDASQLASGIYFYHLQAGFYVQTRKMILIK